MRALLRLAFVWSSMAAYATVAVTWPFEEVTTIVQHERKASRLPLHRGRASQCTISTSPFPPSNAVDGDLETFSHTAWPGVYCHWEPHGSAGRTRPPDPPEPWDSNLSTAVGQWWEIQLPSKATVHKVVLYNRQSCCAERLAPLSISLLGPTPEAKVLFEDRIDTVHSQRQHGHDNLPYSVAPPTPVPGVSFVHLQHVNVPVPWTTMDVLSIAELMVYASVEGCSGGVTVNATRRQYSCRGKPASHATFLAAVQHNELVDLELIANGTSCTAVEEELRQMNMTEAEAVATLCQAGSPLCSHHSLCASRVPCVRTTHIWPVCQCPLTRFGESCEYIASVGCESTAKKFTITNEGLDMSLQLECGLIYGMGNGIFETALWQGYAPGVEDRLRKQGFSVPKAVEWNYDLKTKSQRYVHVLGSPEPRFQLRVTVPNNNHLTQSFSTVCDLTAAHVTGQQQVHVTLSMSPQEVASVSLAGNLLWGTTLENAPDSISDAVGAVVVTSGLHRTQISTKAAIRPYRGDTGVSLWVILLVVALSGSALFCALKCVRSAWRERLDKRGCQAVGQPTVGGPGTAGLDLLSPSRL